MRGPCGSRADMGPCKECEISNLRYDLNHARDMSIRSEPDDEPMGLPPGVRGTRWAEVAKSKARNRQLARHKLTKKDEKSLMRLIALSRARKQEQERRRNGL
ncbi:hypothetical protein GCM10022224_077640 [Nonomuraea antimicrobica]|uniref:BZIP domain-containing protein n=1 Tax=Nonomuraea antimicrobica TaxID=561173 RepID=A0ABP7D6Q3_9ACTN